LQNRLVSVMCDIYTTIIDDTHQKDEPHLPADKNILQAFRHLQEEVGHDSQAERFLICFVARTTPIISMLERQLKKNKFDSGISEDLLAEARSFGLDAIRRTPRVFRVSVSHPPRYKQLDVEYHPDWMRGSNRSISPGLQDLRMRGRLAQDRRQHRSRQASIVTPAENDDLDVVSQMSSQPQQAVPCLRGGAGGSQAGSMFNSNRSENQDSICTTSYRPMSSNASIAPIRRRDGPGHIPGSYPDDDSDYQSVRISLPSTYFLEHAYDFIQPPSIPIAPTAPSSELAIRTPGASPGNPLFVTITSPRPAIPSPPSSPTPPHDPAAPTPEGDPEPTPDQAPQIIRNDAPEPESRFDGWLKSLGNMMGCGKKADPKPGSTPPRKTPKTPAPPTSKSPHMPAAGVALVAHGRKNKPSPPRGRRSNDPSPDSSPNDTFSFLWWRPKKGGRKRRFTLMSYRSRRYDE